MEEFLNEFIDEPRTEAVPGQVRLAEVVVDASGLRDLDLTVQGWLVSIPVSLDHADREAVQLHDEDFGLISAVDSSAVVSFQGGQIARRAPPAGDMRFGLPALQQGEVDAGEPAKGD